MILSVIIVSYNVKFFMEQCLHSVERSLDGLDGPGGSEIIVVDNASSDGSIDYLTPRFPRVRLIPNRGNMGFAAANNLALAEAKGKYVLFLNPDTILPEDCCAVCLAFMQARPDLGAAGVRMIDGRGRFLKESRRGFPSAWVGFCKLSGLAAVFPQSKIFAGYYLGHLPQDKSHPAPILSGACLWTSREVLDKTGGFDERFFMYAEDIDLSYRIGTAGYRNYYIADTTIIHFKGESSSRNIQNTRIFYKAMRQFRQKHYRKGLNALTNVFVETGIRIRGGLAALARMAHSDKSGTRSAEPWPGSRKVWLTGDPAEVRFLQNRLPAASIATAEQDAHEIILCQGRSWSFRDCIGTLQKGPANKTWKIHAADSDSLAGSGSQIDLLVFKKP